MSTVTKDMVVSMHYKLTNKGGELLDSSVDEPLAYLQGHGNIIPGLEKHLDGLKVGDKKQVEVQPEEAYGLPNPELQFAVGLEQFAQGETPQPGMMVQFDSPQGPLMARIVSMEGNQVHLDLNHPLAGEVLFFDIEIADVRPATAEELAHGHPHGPGGHHH